MNFSDKIESFIQSGKVCEIIYIIDENQLVTNDTLEDLVREKRDEILILGSGKRIRLDQIIKLDTVVSPYLC